MNNSPREIPDWNDGNPFLSFAELIRSGRRIGVIATACESEGFYCWDRFDRFGKAEGSDKDKAMDLLAWACSTQQSDQKHGRQNPFADHGYENLNEFLIEEHDHPLWTYGWAAEVCPDFDAIAAKSQQVEQPRRASAEAKTRNTLLIIIAALLKDKGKSPTDRGLSKEISILVDELGSGVSLSDDTVLEWLGKIPDSIASRSK